MIPGLVIAGVLIGLVVIALALDRIGLWAERRGWIYYRRRRSPGAVNLGLLDQIYQPAMEHVIEQEVSEDTLADVDESGAGPVPGGSGATGGPGPTTPGSIAPGTDGE